ncbi:jg23011 [Pararge aegeria aegeria]|uniref:Jg23011 protein n=1 Tax=Pararge aegeria aegeria TaxID=348720 RepID=A0A8S4QVL0_9NEOP|nr:jg23011 [Pararge aegeria aegeria]
MWSLNALRHELERVISERDRLLAESSELGADKATRESERAALRAELREARQREQRLLLDIGDLEDENISLQKQVSALRSSQVEFEGLKHEVRQLREEAENARAAADETAALRRIAERQLAEALEALQAEREAKFAAKKELDAHLSREAQFNITNLAYSIRGMPEEGTESEGEAGASGAGELGADHHADLFSEVHLHEISRLEKQLEQAHNENSQLSSSLRLAQTTSESESAAAGVLRAGLTRVCSRVSALHALHGDCAPLVFCKEFQIPRCRWDPAATCDALNVVCPPRWGSTNAALTRSGLPFQHHGTPTSILSPKYVSGPLPLHL